MADEGVPPLQDGRRECCVCMDDFHESSGALCSPADDEAEKHFVCHACLCGLVRAECHPAGIYEADVTNDALGITSTAGALPCPMFLAGGPCSCVAILDADLLQAMSSPPRDREAIAQFLASNARCLTARAEEEARRGAQQAERARENETALARLRRVVEEMCFAGSMVICPHCGTPSIKNDACMHMDTCPCGGSWCYCCGRASGQGAGQCRRGDGCDALSIYIESNPGWANFALDGQSRGAGARDEFHRRRAACFVRSVKEAAE